jgi:hypothetical protein
MTLKTVFATVSIAGFLAWASPLTAQRSRPIGFAIGGGLLVADNGVSNTLASRGLTAFFRLGGAHIGVPVIFDVAIQHVPHNNDIVTAPCPSPPPACASSDITTALTIAPAVQGTAHVSPGTWLFEFGPSAHWLVERNAGTDAVVLGLRGGLGFRVGPHATGLLLSADYFRLFRGGIAPQWFLPITLGWQF